MRLPENDRKSMIALIEQWQKSGMRQKDFYQQHNIPAHVFYYWDKCFRKQQAGKINKPLLKASSFIQLQPLQKESVNNMRSVYLMAFRFPHYHKTNTGRTFCK